MLLSFYFYFIIVVVVLNEMKRNEYGPWDSDKNELKDVSYSVFIE